MWPDSRLLAVVALLLALGCSQGSPPSQTGGSPAASAAATPTAGGSPAASAAATKAAGGCPTWGADAGDLALLRAHGQARKQYSSSSQEMAAARRVFALSGLIGCGTEALVADLGEPAQKGRDSGGDWWRYEYHDGEVGVFRKLYLEGGRVTAVHVIPTQ